MSRPAGGNLLTKTPRDALTIIENKSKVRNSRNKPIFSKVSTNAPSSPTPHSPEIAALVDAVKAMLHQKSSPLASVKAVEEICVTCGGPHPYYQCLAMDGNVFPKYQDNIQGYVFSCHQLNYNQEIPGSVLKDVANQIRTPGFDPLALVEGFTPVEDNRGMLVALGIFPDDGQCMQTRSSSKFVGEPSTNPTSTIPNRHNRRRSKQRVKPFSLEENALTIIENKSKVRNSRNKPIVSKVSTNAPSYTPHSPEIAALVDAVKAMLHQKSSPLASVKAVEEICVTCGGTASYHQCLSHVECLALADLGASINLMPLSIWKKLSLPELTPTQMILKLADRSTTSPSGITEGVFVKVGKFYFPDDFVVVDYVVDPRVLNSWRTFLRTTRALIDVYGEELTLRVDDEAITFKVGQTSRYSYNDVVSINRIDVIDVACEEYAQEVLGFSDSSTSVIPLRL
ncbi:reverse transcriptase domain-containing protein [Tanacetum coccineum]